MDSAKSLEALYAELGTRLFEAGRHDEAVDVLNKALTEPVTGISRAAIYLTLGKTYMALDKEPDALKTFAEAVRLDPDTFQEVEKELSKFQAEKTEQNKASAKRGGFSWLWNVVSSLKSTSGPLFIKMAKDLFEKEKYAEAEVLFSYVATLSPKDANIHESLGWARLKQNKSVESIGSFLQANALDNTRVSVFQGLGDAYLSLGQNQKAVEALGQALILKPDQPAVLRLYGVALRQIGDLAASEASLRHLLEIESEDDSVRHELAETLKAQGKNTDAAAELIKAADLLLAKKQYSEMALMSQEAIDLDPANGTAHLQLGQARIGQKLYDEALQVLSQAAKLLEPGPEVHQIIAKAKFLKGDLEKALESINEALNLGAESSEALGIKGAILQRFEKYEESLTLLDKSLGLTPTQAQFQTERGHALEGLERPLEAIAAYGQAIELVAASRWAQARLGMLLFFKADYEAAASALGRGLELPPDENEDFYSVEQPLPVYPETLLYTARGQALAELNQSEEAIREFDHALELDPGNADASYWRGYLLTNLGRSQEAVTAFQLAVDLYAAQGIEDNAVVYAHLGEALRESGKHREAKTAFERALSLDPDDQWVLARMGETLRVLNKNEEALKYLKRATELDAEDGWAWGALGATHQSLDNYRSALEALDKAIQLAPDDSFNWAYKGKVLRDVQRLNQAIDSFNSALGIDRSTAWVLVEKALALRQMSGLANEEAITLLENAIQLSPDTGYYNCQLAISLYYFGRPVEALAQVDKATQLDPSLDWASCIKSLILEKLGQAGPAREAEDGFLSLFQGAEAYYERGSIYGDLRVYDRAIRDLEEAVQLDRKFKNAHNYLGWIHANSQSPDWESALRLAKKAVELYPEDSDSLDTLGWIYFKRDLLEDALPLLKKAADLNPEQLEIDDHLEACRRRIEEVKVGNVEKQALAGAQAASLEQ